MNPSIILEENRVTLSSEALILLNVTQGERILINYVQVSSEYTFPVIGKSEFFSTPEAGNKLTKSNTVSFRGMQNKVLRVYGDKFSLQPYKSGIYKMIKFNINNKNE